MEKVLIIEDEVDIAQIVAFNLERNGYLVNQVHDGREGLKKNPERSTQSRHS